MRRKVFAARIWAKLVLDEKKLRLLKPGDRILAAVSGGPDSISLAHYLNARRRKLGFELFLAHVHHNLRGKDADKDAAFVLKFGKALGLQTQILRADARALAKKRGQGLEEAARKGRYGALAREAQRLRCNKVAAGHHLDDQAETVFLNLIRGTKLSALAAMSSERPLAKKIRLIRPLLGLRRSEIMEYLKVHELKHRLDKTNLSSRYTRNWIRKEIIPALEKRNPQIREHLASIADQVRKTL